MRFPAATTTEEQLKTIAGLYNDIEEGKSFITEISCDRRAHDVTSLGNLHQNYIKSGFETVTITIERMV